MNYFQIGVLITDYLHSRQAKSGTLFDEHINSEVPDNHYAHTYYALSQLLAYSKFGDSQRLQSAIDALRWFFAINSNNHIEFNNLAILLIENLIRNKKIDINSNIRENIKKYINTMSFNVRPGIQTANNWIALKALSLMIRGKICNCENNVKKGCDLINNHVLNCQLKDGFFYDYPAVILAEVFSTPLTYHAKICSVLAMFLEWEYDFNLIDALKRGLDIFSHFIGPDGEALYYGRTNNGLFGYISAIYAYQKAVDLQIVTSKERLLYYQSCAAKILRFIQNWQQKDGHINIAPNHLEKMRCGWDKYMYTTVYNAYAASFLMMLGDRNISESFQNKEENRKFLITHAEHAGLLSINTNNNFIAFSTKGQSPKGYDYFFDDMRYWGMNILSFKYRGVDVIPPPPLDLNPKEHALDPMRCGFVPVIRCNQHFYTVISYKNITKVVEKEKVICLFGEGSFSFLGFRKFYQKHPLAKRILRKIYREIFHVRPQAIFAENLSSLKLRRLILIILKQPIIIFVDYFEGVLNKVDEVVFSFRLWDGIYRINGNKITQLLEKNNKTEVVFENAYPKIDLHDLNCNKICTSKGKCLILSKSNKALNLIINSVYIKKTDEFFELDTRISYDFQNNSLTFTFEDITFEVNLIKKSLSLT